MLNISNELIVFIIYEILTHCLCFFAALSTTYRIKRLEKQIEELNNKKSSKIKTKNKNEVKK